MHLYKLMTTAAPQLLAEDRFKPIIYQTKQLLRSWVNYQHYITATTDAHGMN